MSEKAFLLDTTKCIGCRACQVACKQWNGLPGEQTDFFAGPEYTNPAGLSSITWNYVKFFEVDRTNEEHPVWQIMHTKCFHCEDANCLKVCPERAISKVDGWVVIDQNKCIGCGACVNECIYHVPHIRKSDSKTYKCNACTVNEREIPACAFACPTGALTYGNRTALLQEAQLKLKKYTKAGRDADGNEIPPAFPKAQLYGKDQFSGLKMLVILRDRPSKYGLEENPRPLEITKIEQIHDTYALMSMFTLGIPSLKRAAYRFARSLANSSDRSRIS
jgi:formate dehydrogenase iron-sulfur subunit